MMFDDLKSAAVEINRLAEKQEDTQRELCIAIAKAMDLVKREANLTWRAWADENLRRPDGSKWSIWTLYHYASYGRDPVRLEKSRGTIAAYGRLARASLRRLPIDSLPVNDVDVRDQVDEMMAVWRRMSLAARKEFLRQVGFHNEAFPRAQFSIEEPKRRKPGAGRPRQ